MIRDVLVFTPVLRLEAETVQALLALEWDGPLSVLLQRDNPTGDGHVDHLHQYRRAREFFLRGTYDALLVVESDIVPPPDALKRLAALDADCAYGVYLFRVTPVANVLERYPGQPRNEGESLSIHPEKLQAALAAGIVPCSGGGLGCVLIRRHVLEVVEFRRETEAHCDTDFNREVMRRGFVQMAEMGVTCGHKRPDGEVLWPHWGKPCE